MAGATQGSQPLLSLEQAGNRSLQTFRLADATYALHATMCPAAGLDIARLLSQEAAVVYVCAREWRSQRDVEGLAVRGCANTQRRGMISRLSTTG